VFFCIGHWKFVLTYFVSAIDTKNIFWPTQEQDMKTTKKWVTAIDWGYSLSIAITYTLSLTLAHDPANYTVSLFINNCILTSVVVLYSLNQIRNLLAADINISQSQGMMRVHFVVFTLFLITSISKAIPFYGYKLGFMGYRKFAVSFYGVECFGGCINFILNEFVAYLILQFSNQSKDLYVEMAAL